MVMGFQLPANIKCSTVFIKKSPPVDASTQGSGIGLSIEKELIELHHGSIELETDLNKGCLFTLWLPCGTSHFLKNQLIETTSVAENQGIEKGIFENENSKHTTVLVVDDNAELRDFICQRLASSFTIITASDGLSGYNSAIKNLPDIIISDITMPIMSGLELTQKLKEHAQTSSIPILLLSAQTNKRDIVNGFAYGADDYLIKPFDTSELIMRVNAVISSRKNNEWQKMNPSNDQETSVNEALNFEHNMQKINFSKYP
jgi:CheY-like chemotaxis protein